MISLRFFPATLAICALSSCAKAQPVSAPPSVVPSSVLPPDALFSTSVGGLERTAAKTSLVAVQGQSFSRALRVEIGKSSSETNATQETILNAAPVAHGQTLRATFWVRGQNARRGSAHIQFLWERATQPWEKSIALDVLTPPNGSWKRVSALFVSAKDYKSGEAMASLRFAFGPQWVEIGDFSLVSLGQNADLDALLEREAAALPLQKASVHVETNKPLQRVDGLGGNFPIQRYGSTETMGAVGAYNLAHLRVAQARVGIPLDVWAPQKGVFKDEGPAHAALLQLQLLARRRVPLIGSVWEGPAWLLGGSREQAGRVLPREKYNDCIEAIAQFLVAARDKYGAKVDFFSFNEADYGVNFKFSPAQIADFIALAGPRFRALGLQTKFLVGDTGGGINAAPYIGPQLRDGRIQAFLGPIAFHCWDVLGAPDESYRAIAGLGRKSGKPIWATEAGHDSDLWNQTNPWPRWENALRTAQAYEKTLRLSGAAVLDYWTYQNNYPLVSSDGQTPFPVWNVVRTFERALPRGARVLGVQSDNPDLQVLATRNSQNALSLVLINPGGALDVQLSGLSPKMGFSSVLNAASAPMLETANALHSDARGGATLRVPPRSVLALFPGRS